MHTLVQTRSREGAIKMPQVKQTYRYIKANTIIGNSNTELSNDELSLLYRFYVLNSPCKGCSDQPKDFKDYGWQITKNFHYDHKSIGLKQKLNAVFDVDNIAIPLDISNII